MFNPLSPRPSEQSPYHVYFTPFILPPPTHLEGGPFAHALFTGTALGALYRSVIATLGGSITSFLSTAVPALPFVIPALTLSTSSTYSVLGLAGTIAAFFK